MDLRVKTFLIAGIIELASLLVLGWNPRFLYGLILGSLIAIGNFSLLTATSKLALKIRRGKSVSVLSYIVRLMIYGGVFLVSYRLGTESGVATLLGFLTLKIALYHEHGIRPGFKKQEEV